MLPLKTRESQAMEMCQSGETSRLGCLLSRHKDLTAVSEKEKKQAIPSQKKITAEAWFPGNKYTMTVTMIILKGVINNVDTSSNKKI